MIFGLPEFHHSSDRGRFSLGAVLSENTNEFKKNGDNIAWAETGFLNRSAALLNKISFCCLLGLIVLTVVPYGTVDPWWESVFECGVFGIAAIWIFQVLLRRQWNLGAPYILVPLILITGYAFLQTINLPILSLQQDGIVRHHLSIDRYQTLLTARKTLALTVFLGLLLLHTSTAKRFRWLIRFVIGIGLASALFAILRQSLQSPESTTGFGLPFLFYGLGYGQFISPNAFAYLMEMTLALLGGLVLGGAARRDTVLLYVATMIVTWAALVLSSSRGGLLSFGCQFIFLVFMGLTWYSKRQLSRPDGRQHPLLLLIRTSVLVRIAAILLIAITLFVGVVWMGGEDLVKKFDDGKSASEETIGDLRRKDIWRASWALIKDHPLLGVGFGAYSLAIPRYQNGSGGLKLEQAHNEYLDLTANGGVLALGLAGWFLAMLILRLKYSFRSADAYRCAAGLGAAAGIISVAVHSFFDFGLQLTGNAVVFAALVVISVADYPTDSTATDRRSLSSRAK